MAALATILPNIPPGVESLLPSDLQSLIQGVTATATATATESEVKTETVGASSTANAAANVMNAAGLFRRVKGSSRLIVTHWNERLQQSGMRLEGFTCVGVVLGGLTVLL